MLCPVRRLRRGKSGRVGMAVLHETWSSIDLVAAETAALHHTISRFDLGRCTEEVRTQADVAHVEEAKR
jgi:hypothetical protein